MNALEDKALERTATAAASRRRSDGLQRAMRGVYIIWLREFKRFWRDRARRIGGFAQPIIYLALLGGGMQSAFKVFGGGDVSYVKFMFPGILGMAVVEPPMILPMATLERGTGDTSTSLRKPNSRSQMMEMSENTAVKSTVIPRMPGNMNFT